MVENTSSGELTPPSIQSTAVLFLVFNRPETTLQVFEAIRGFRPERLYVAADGARPGRDDEAARCRQVRRIATAVDWPCQVRTLFRDENLGCRVAVSSAIDWFFKNEPEGIILEDDCLPDKSFFQYTTELLSRYRSEERIVTISAQHFHGDLHKPEGSYFFSRYNHCWGWASWRRSWQYYDHDMEQWPKLRHTDWLLELGNGNRFFKSYWTDIFDRTFSGELDTWDYRWTFSCWVRDGLAVLPARNLVTNIGFGADATHTTDTNSTQASLPLESLVFPLVHPRSVVRDSEADQWTEKYHYHINLRTMLVQLIKRVPGLKPLFRYARQTKWPCG